MPAFPSLHNFKGLPFSTYADFPAFWTPLPPPRTQFTQPISPVVRKNWSFLQHPPPPRCVRTEWKPPISLVLSSPVLFHVGRHSPAVGVRVVALHRLEAGDAVEAAAHEQLVTDGDGTYGTGKDTRPCDSL